MTQVACWQYLLLLLALLTLLWLVINIIKILYRQGKYKVLPLTCFYGAATVNCLLNCIYAIWFFPIFVDIWIPLWLLPQTSKFCFGIVQTWINLELYWIISYHLRTATGIPRCASRISAKCINNGRIALAAFICLALLGTTIGFTWLTIVLSHDDRKNFVMAAINYYVIALQIIDFFLLTVSISLVVVILNKQKQFTEDKTNF